MASTNAHALDYVLCRIWDIPEGGVYTLRAARRLGLLPPPAEIEIIGADIDALRPNPRWKLAYPMNLQRLVGPAFMAPLMERLIGVKPLVHHEKCTLCMECAHHCAAMAMDADTGVIRIDEKKCISCFCCQEMCPQGAITIKSGPLANLLGLRK